MKTIITPTQILDLFGSPELALNDLYYRSEIKRLYQLPSFENFSYTPFISVLMDSFQIVDILEIIFFFKLNLIAENKNAPTAKNLDIILKKDTNGMFSIRYFAEDILIHSANIGKRSYRFKSAAFTLLENYAGKPFLLATPEEISDKSNLINL